MTYITKKSLLVPEINLIAFLKGRKCVHKWAIQMRIQSDKTPLTRK